MTYVFVALVIGLTIIGFYLKKSVLTIAAGLSWALLAFTSFGNSSAANPTEITDVYMGLFWMGMLMLIVCIFESLYMRSKKEIVEDGLAESETESLQREYDEAERETAIPHFGRRKHKSKIGRALKRLS